MVQPLESLKTQKVAREVDDLCGRGLYCSPMSWYQRIGQWLEDNAFKVDLFIAGLLCAISMSLAVAFTSNYTWFFGYDITGLWAATFAFLLVAPLAIRRTHPLLCLIIIYSAALFHMLYGPPLIFPADLSTLVALYSVALLSPRWAHHTALTFSIIGAGLFGHAATGFDPFRVQPILLSIFTIGLLFLTAWAFGLLRRSRLETFQALTLKNTSLEVERDQQLRLGAANERSRIAREMHDIVAHSLSVIIAQADGGRYAATSNPEMAAKSLTTIADTGRAALADMRRLLGVLRDQDNGENSAQHLPQPAQDSIETLVESLRDAGIKASLVRTGTERLLPPGAGLTLYRVCQESLTNVLKHAGADPTVAVMVNWAPDRVQLIVEDNGRGSASLAGSDGAGMGLLGMKERAALFGGTISAGPAEGGGFRVKLDLPLPPASRS